MTPLLKKEIRLLLPAWLAVVVIEALVPWFGRDVDWNVSALTPVALFFGIILLAVDSFGREFSLGTFSSLMVQPMDRRQVWQTKITLLLLAVGLVFCANFISCQWRLHLAITDRDSLWSGLNSRFIIEDSHHAMLASFVLVFVALTGGLWTTLLLRQIAAAFWITLMVPVGLMLMLALVMSQLFKSVPDEVGMIIIYGLATVYGFIGFWFAHRLFFRAQDAGWSGGVISLERWRYLEGTGTDTESRRRHRPVRALLKKEFQLNSITLFCAGALLVLHGVVLAWRLAHARVQPRSSLAEAMDFFWVMWLAMPLVISCTTVAEERKLGVADSQLCLPVSRRALFFIKFIPALFFGVLLGGVVPVLLESLASALGVPADSFKPQNHAATGFGDGMTLFRLNLLCLSGGLSLAGFLASTFARNFLHALTFAIVAIIVIYAGFPYLPLPDASLSLSLLLGVPLLTATLLWVGYRAFSYYPELNRGWSRYLAAVVGAWILLLVICPLVYQRTWERLTPFVPAHGPTQWTLARPPVALRGNADLWTGNLLVSLPDGRVWTGLVAPGARMSIPNETLWNFREQLFNDPAPQLARAAFLDGTNWLSLVTGARQHQLYPEYLEDSADYQRFTSRDTVGIRTDGTLWVSEKSGDAPGNNHPLVQFGTDTHWRQVMGFYTPFAVALLKTDGTLWVWGKRTWPSLTAWPGLHSFTPRQIGTNDDWQALVNLGFPGVQKADGSVWSLSFKNNNDLPDTQMLANFPDRQPHPEPLNNSKLAAGGSDNLIARIRPDGTLWIWGHLHWDPAHNDVNDELLQCSPDTNWVSVALGSHVMLALKSDGTLWRWGGEPYYRQYADDYTRAPEPIGTHSAWVALMQSPQGVVTLADDGSLWLWRNLPDPWQTSGRLLKPSVKPVPLGNILAAN